MYRVRLLSGNRHHQFKPQWKGPIEGYTVNQASDALWRMHGLYDMSDLIGEGQLIFAKLEEDYRHVDNAAWFMSLYKASLTRRFDWMASRAYVAKKAPAFVKRKQAVSRDLARRHGESNEGALLCLLAEAPDEIREVMHALINDTVEHGRTIFDTLANFTGRDGREVAEQIRRYLTCDE